MASEQTQNDGRTQKPLYVALKIALLLEDETKVAFGKRINARGQLVTQTAQGVVKSERVYNEIEAYVRRSFAKNKRKLGAIVRDYMPQ